MKRRSISKKLFLMSSAIVAVVLSFQMIFQYFWLESFYTHMKTQSMKKMMYEIKSGIENSGMDKDHIDEYIEKRSSSEDAVVGLSNLAGIPKYGVGDEPKVSYIKVKDGQEKTYTVYMEPLEKSDEVILNINENDMVSIEGLVEEKEMTVNPALIEFAAGNAATGIQTSFSIDVSDSVSMGEISVIAGIATEKEPLSEIVKAVEIRETSIQGTIVEKNIAEKKYGYEYRRNKLIQEMFSFTSDEKKMGKMFDDGMENLISYSDVDGFTGMNNMIFAQPVKLNGNETMIMFAVVSLQPVEQLKEMMKSYFMVVLVLSIMVAVLVSYLYSRRITEPLLHLDSVTAKMAELDFSKSCQVSSDDEIEDLAESINRMSSKLQLTLDELKGANSKLRYDIASKEKMDELRKRFIADASHELKTPLTVIKGICEGMMDGIYDKDDEQNFKNMLSHINDMKGLVYDLLETCRLESGECGFSNAVFQLSDVVLMVNQSLKTMAVEKDISVRLDLDEDFVMADEEKIERVIRNLFNNAVKYTKPGGLIDISMKREGEKTLLEMENSPARIEEADLERVWDAFYTVDESRNKSLGGTGLGLHMVREILEGHGSEYLIENTERGVRVSFSLDRVDAEAQ